MRVRRLPWLPRGRRATLADGPNPQAARHALRTCLAGEKAVTVGGRCLRCGYGTSVSEQIRFQIDCMALERFASLEDRYLLAAATRAGKRDVIFGRTRA